MRLVIAVLFLLLLSSVFALDCSNVRGEALKECNAIMASNLSNADKQQLVADLVYTDRDFANHSFIYDWNTDIEFNSVPEEVKVESNGYIKDAWLKIVAVTPSVLSEDKLLSPGTGKVLSAYNYRVELPSGKEGRDCRTDYNLASNQNWLDVYLNDNLIGNSKLTDFQVPEDLDFKDELKIKTVTEVKHYENERYCCRTIRGICRKHCNKCKYRSTEYRTDEVNLEDSRKAYLYSPLILSEIRAVDKYHDTTVGILNISNFTSFSLNFENASFKQFNYYYNANVSLAPYDVLTLRANRFTKKESDNINVEQINDSYKFYVANPNECKIQFYDHFNSFEQTCNLNSDFPLLKVETNKLQYKENETINVDLEPKDTQVKVKYGDEEVLAQNSVQFKANQNHNKITAYLGERKSEKVIHVKKDGTWDFALDLGVFSGIMYSFYLLIRKYLWFI